MQEMRAFCDQLAAEAKQKTSAGNKEQTVKAFIARHSGNNLSAYERQLPAGREQTSRSLARRNDVRVQPYLGVYTGNSDLVAGTNIFADSALHVHAAASLAALAQSNAGFDASMPTSQVQGRLEAYISEVARDPHWIFVGSTSSTVIHEPAKPQEFSRRLVATIANYLQGIGADAEGIVAATNSVNLLASILSSSSAITDTHYAAMGIFRGHEGPESRPAVFYSFSSIGGLPMNHERFRKSSPLPAVQAEAFTLVFQLDSPMLVENEKLYSRLPVSSVADWFHSLII